MTILKILLITILSQQISASSVYTEVSFDPVFTMVEEQTDPAENSINFFGNTYGARLGFLAHNDKLSYEAHYYNSKVAYEYDATYTKTSLHTYGVGAYYFLNKSFRLGGAINRFSEKRTQAAGALDGYLLSIEGTHTYSIYQDYYLTLSFLYSVLTFGESNASQSLKLRSLLLGLGRSF